MAERITSLAGVEPGADDRKIISVGSKTPELTVAGIPVIDDIGEPEGRDYFDTSPLIEFAESFPLSRRKDRIVDFLQKTIGRSLRGIKS